MRLNVKTEFAWDANYLFYTVREPFPTKTTGTSLVFGRVTTETPLILESRMAENGVIFSDGIEQDFLEFNSGTRATVSLAARTAVVRPHPGDEPIVISLPLPQSTAVDVER